MKEAGLQNPVLTHLGFGIPIPAITSSPGVLRLSSVIISGKDHTEN